MLSKIIPPKIMTSKPITLFVVNNALAFADDTRHAVIVQGDSLFDMVQSVYPKGLPLNTFLYHGFWETGCDITPQNGADIDEINRLTGRFFIVTYPAVAMPLLAMLAISVLVSLAVAFLMPMPTMPGTNGQPPSPNNALAQRVNQQRIGGRVPDIFGTLWAVPDLIAPSYSVYVNHLEVEFAMMCLGRGVYDVQQACDDTTPIEQINGTTVEVYNPYISVNATASKRFGNAYLGLEEQFSRLLAKKYTSVNGQVLVPPDNFIDKNLVGNQNGTITGSDILFTGQFSVGDKVTITNADKLASANNVQITDTTNPNATAKAVTYNLNGEYTVKSVDETVLTLDNPQAISADWQKLTDNQDFTVADKMTVSTKSESLWQGWFYTDNSDFTDIMINIVAPNGLYHVGSKDGDWMVLGVTYRVQVQILDKDDVILNDFSKDFIINSRNAEKHRSKINGTSWTKDEDVRRSAAQTTLVAIPARQNSSDKIRFRVRRLTDTQKMDGSTSVQEIRLKDFYSVRYFTGFEQTYDSTTIYVKQKATEGALSVKERKLRLLVQRYVKDWQNNDVLKLSNRIDDIIYHIVTDPATGGLTEADINMPQLKAEIDSQIEYFGTPLCSEFCGTFDNTDVTTEEMVQTVAQAGFCQAYRMNNQINLHFERATPLSVVQFNSHNILPDSFDYSESFGARNDYDGVQVTYADPTDDAKITLNFPLDGSASNPEKKDLAGVRNKTQAYMHATRNHWKNQLAYKTCEFIGADESGIVIPTNRIDVANQNNADTLQGVVETQTINPSGQSVLIVSEPVNLDENQTATLFVQTISGVVDNIACQRGEDDYTLVLSRPPSQPLSLDNEAVVRATYKLVTHNDLNRDSYIVTAKEAGSNSLSHKLTCINYTDNYYQNDSDFIKNLIPPDTTK